MWLKTASTYRAYHGTKSQFQQFQHMTGKRTSTLGNEWEVKTGGFFFSDNIADAKTFGDRVVEVALTLNNPFVDLNNNFDSEDAAYILEPMLEIEQGEGSRRVWLLGSIWSKPVGWANDPDRPLGTDWTRHVISQWGKGLAWDAIDTPGVTERMKERGYDGCIVEEPETSSGFSYFVMHPSQIQIVRWL